MIQSLNVFSEVIGYSKDELAEIVHWLKDEELTKRVYYTYKKKKSNGKIRVIAPSYNKLKDIQNRLVTRVFSHVRFPYYITGAVKGRSGVVNAKMHSGKLFHLKTDLVSFFDFVTNREVYSALMALGFSPKVASIITQLTTYKGHLPQGTPTSPFLANLVGLSIDKFYIDYAKDNNLIYTRFVDDIIFSSDNDFKDDVNFLLSKINEKGYLFSYKKTFYKKGDIQITGAKVSCNGIELTDDQGINLFSRSISENSRKGLVAHFSHIHNVNKNFRISHYKKLFADINHPNAIWPKMNLPKNGLNITSPKVSEYFENNITSRG